MSVSARQQLPWCRGSAQARRRGRARARGTRRAARPALRLTAPPPRARLRPPQKRLILGAIASVGLAAFALVPTKELRPKPSKPLYFYIVSLLRIQDVSGALTRARLLGAGPEAAGGAGRPCCRRRR